MSQEKHCSKCGAPLSGEVAGGFCTACLLEVGLSPADLAQTPIALRYFGDYELIEEIARGGMGVVFKARQRSLNRIVAVKMILSGHLASETQAQRFRAEARAAAALQHPGIVTIHEVGEHEGLLFFSMDYVAGQNLAQSVRDGPWPAARAAQCVRDIAEAIQYAHERGVLHRDLKPSNVLMDAHGKPHVTDFGLAKRLDNSELETRNSELTQSGQVLGSPNFMPPEQAAGKHRELTPASDVYSLGAILYHCLTGRPPFVAETLTQTLRMVAEQEPVSPRLLNASVPRDLETICLKCLEKYPSRRYPSAQVLAEDLSRFLNNEPIQARPAGLVLKVHRWCVRNKPLAISGTAILALLLVVAIGSPIAALRINRERAKAVTLARSESKAKEAEAAQRKRAEEVSEFLTKAFRSPDPARDGRTITIVEVLDRGAQELQDKFADDPHTKATLLINIAWAYSALSLIDKSVPLFEQAFELRNRYLGAQDDETVQAKQILALHYWLVGQTAKAVTLAEEGYQARLGKFGPDYLSTQIAQFELGKYYSAAGRNREGQEMMERAFNDLNAKLGPDHPEVFWHTTAMADLYRDLGRTEEALALDEPLLEFRRAKMRLDHPDTLHSMRSVAEDYIALGRAQEASTLLQECVKLSKIRLGPNHSQTQLAERRLAELQAPLELHEALLGLAKAIELSPTNHSLLFQRGKLFGQLGRWPEAAASLRQTIEADPAGFDAYLRLAPILLLLGDEAGYRQLCERMVAQFSGAKDPGAAHALAKACSLHPNSGVDSNVVAEAAETAVTLGKQSDIFPWFALCKSLAEYRQQHFASAADWAQRTLAAAGPPFPERDAAAYLVLAMAQAKLKQDAAAHAALNRGVKIVDQMLPKLDSSHLGVRWVGRIIAEILLREARALIERDFPKPSAK